MVSASFLLLAGHSFLQARPAHPGAFHHAQQRHENCQNDQNSHAVGDNIYQRIQAFGNLRTRTASHSTGLALRLFRFFRRTFSGAGDGLSTSEISSLVIGSSSCR